MRKFANKYIIGIDHGFGNIKTANCCFPTGVLVSDTEPTFKQDLLIYEGRYYQIGVGHKEYAAEKIGDEDYYVLTLAAIARELHRERITCADVHIAAGLPLTWVGQQKESFKAYLLQKETVSFRFKGVDYNIRIVGADVFPKGFAAIADRLHDFKGSHMLCDIGNGTMNILRITDTRPDPRNMFTEKFGVNQCVLALRENLLREHNQCYSSVRTGSYESRKKKGLPLDGICQTPMIPEWRLQMMANLIFRKYLSQKDKVLALANSILEVHIGDTEETQNKEAILKSKQGELARLSKKLDGYIEMRSEGDLSREAFRMKCAELEPRMQQLQKEIEKLSAEAAPKEVVDYTQKLTVLQYALEQYTNRDEGQDVPESVIEAFVVKIVVSKDGFDWYLRFDGDPDKPLRCQLQGKRKTNTKIMVAGDISPAMDSGTTGCYQGLIPNIKIIRPEQSGRIFLWN